jgi:hypothetical protein
VVDISAPDHGRAEATNDGRAIRYTPEADFHGTDRFQYQVADGRGGSTRATVTVTVSAKGPVLAGGLAIDSDPPGAEVFIDGALRGTTPLQLERVPVGSREIVLKKEGYAADTTSVDVAAQQEARVRAELAMLMGTLRVRPVPWGHIYVDGTRVSEGIDRWHSMELPPGRHSITVENPVLERTWTSVVDIGLDEPREVVVDLTQQVSVSIAAKDTDGQPVYGPIYVDGERIGYAPRVIEVYAGHHQIEVRADGYRQVAVRELGEDASIPAGEAVNIDQGLEGGVLHVILEKEE